VCLFPRKEEILKDSSQRHLNTISTKTHIYIYRDTHILYRDTWLMTAQLSLLSYPAFSPQFTCFEEEEGEGERMPKKQ